MLRTEEILKRNLGKKQLLKKSDTMQKRSQPGLESRTHTHVPQRLGRRLFPRPQNEKSSK